MSVYVDDPIHPFGRMMMCHMIADTREELLTMVDRIGVQRKWIQKQDTPDEHFDICISKRSKAIVAGAKVVMPREIVRLIQLKRARLSGGGPHRLQCDLCFDIPAFSWTVQRDQEHDGCGGHYRLVDIRSVA